MSFSLRHSALHHGHPAEAVRYYRLAALASERVVAMDEAITQVDQAIEAAASLDPAAARAQLPELYLLRGLWSGRAGKYAEGSEDLRQALRGAREIGDEQLETQVLNELGWLIRVLGYEEAISLHQEALRIAQRLDEPSAQVTALSRMSMIHLNRLRLDEGVELAQRAVGIARATGRDPLLGTALDCLKLAALQLGDLGLLERTVAEIIEVQERAGDHFLLQWGYIEGATVPLARGDLPRARERMEKAAAINRRFTSDRVGRALLLEAGSWIERADGDPAAAVSSVEDALEVIGDQPAPEWSAWLLASLGSHLVAHGRPAEAIGVLESALACSEAIKSPNRAFRAASHLALARRLTGDDAGAQAALTQALGVLGTMTAPPGAVFLDGYRSYLAIARTCVELGEAGRARDLLLPLVAVARRHGWRSAADEATAILDQL